MTNPVTSRDAASRARAGAEACNAWGRLLLHQHEVTALARQQCGTKISLRPSPRASSLPFQRTVAKSDFASSKTRSWSLCLLFTEALPRSMQLNSCVVCHNGGCVSTGSGASCRVPHSAPTRTCRQAPVGNCPWEEVEVAVRHQQSEHRRSRYMARAVKERYKLLQCVPVVEIICRLLVGLTQSESCLCMGGCF